MLATFTKVKKVNVISGLVTLPKSSLLPAAETNTDGDAPVKLGFKMSFKAVTASRYLRLTEVVAHG